MVQSVMNGLGKGLHLLAESINHRLTILLYNFFLWLYSFSIRIVSPWNRKAAAWINGRKGIFKTISNAGIKGSKRVWMHCSSLGEFEQGRPVIESLKKLYPDSTIVISFFSPSGYEIRKNYPGADHIFYLPMDSAVNAKRFLDLVNPFQRILKGGLG